MKLLIMCAIIVVHLDDVNELSTRVQL